ncbi:aspartate carbamoyltransferase regulatory subunit [Breznakia sp. PF5-3]|uniref:aspartate carbamoyltransferase regulatory subunit n=1 Tax=unclassified Breznakia TaxID=2623764 RepID=UPI0024064B43|nr:MULTISPECIES: aspartate carbamoyltransferase regulatory subunit [unclassified Breznakia]MDF9824603.1 aspartate carbamoyltransferase regulatory subunit [Breznakia sp. PM6-1]MDF9835539.1 aspartate carbamoyltransferase regulatory subunit [Breznakia sp. PF5-3]MDF9837959.1 aspartate carbamoyltransferase regulatory subunit [Breznakia sp. PFB2-8]MDF9859948.1 aspartate carbamoyltransferase regulatory subunit [Breznakia sp. PH5-24]
MNIDSIKNGIVLDHISAGKSMRVYDSLNLDELDCSVAIIKNVKSQKMGRKDIIKIDNDFEIDLDVLGYIDPNITVSYIKDGITVEKKKLALPETITNVEVCKNPRCITSVETSLPQTFKLVDKENHVYRCVYCESRIAK